MCLDPVHHRAVADLQVPADLPEVETIGIHADGQLAGLMAVTMMFADRRVAGSAMLAAVPLAVSVGEAIFVLAVRSLTLGTVHGSILLLFTIVLSTPPPQV